MQYKIPKFGVNRPKSKQDTAIWKCQSLQRNVWQSGRCSTQNPDAIHFFVNFEVFKSLLSQSQLSWLTPNLGILWVSVSSFWLCGSIVANPIIYRLVPSPSRFENRQWCGDHKVSTPASGSSSLGYNPGQRNFFAFLVNTPYSQCLSTLSCINR